MLSILLATGYCHMDVQYDPTFASLDSRPLPEWFGQAKLGIFLHLGLYSYPQWSMRGSYEEWYQVW
jgi:alpha-L-fucosidase